MDTSHHPSPALHPEASSALEAFDHVSSRITLGGLVTEYAVQDEWHAAAWERAYPHGISGSSSRLRVGRAHQGSRRSAFSVHAWVSKGRSRKIRGTLVQVTQQKPVDEAYLDEVPQSARVLSCGSLHCHKVHQKVADAVVGIFKRHKAAHVDRRW